MNFIHIAGHLGADPEVGFTTSGKKVTTLRVATKTRRNQENDTIWWRVTVWGEQYDKMVPYLKKGSPIMAMGELKKPEIYTDREGKPQPSMEITASHLQFSPFGKSQEGAPQATPGFTPAANPQQTSSNSAPPVNPYVQEAPVPQGSTFDDEVPF